MLVNLNDVLVPAKKGKYGVGMFNAVNLEMANAIFQAAEELRAPVIIGTAEILLGAASLENLADMVLNRARRSPVPVVLHYDHGLSFDKCMEAVRLGFSSIMYDCSTASYEENIRQLKEMVKICHAMNISVEGELGHVGDNAGAGKLEKPDDYYTDPDRAEEFVKETGVDALAVAVGNAHGDYAFPPRLDFGRIEAIRDRTGIPLVLHGGSGLSDSDFRKAIARGICKVNIFTDINKAQAAGMKKAMDAGLTGAFEMTPYEVEAIRVVVEEKMRLFSSPGHAAL